jgi:hypothetical protein
MDVSAGGTGRTPAHQYALISRQLKLIYNREKHHKDMILKVINIIRVSGTL